MAGINLPYSPLRWKLYSSSELFEGFEPTEPASWAQTADFAIYHHFIVEGKTTPSNPFMGMMQALHDNSITQATTTVIAGRKVAAIMGGHKMTRNSKPYRDVTFLARQLTRAGILVCTGGGPGAMEASHLGAALAEETDQQLEEALSLLGTRGDVPALAKIVTEDGKVNHELVSKAHAWFKPAHEIVASISSKGESLAIPTWHYGHEPSTPFATHIAKYFQNSIREDGLLALAKQGIIYAEGKAGTIQEIFQDAAQNFYGTFEYFSPMVLLGEDYWTEHFPVVKVLQKLFKEDDYKNRILITDDVHAAAEFIERFNP